MSQEYINALVYSSIKTGNVSADDWQKDLYAKNIHDGLDYDNANDDLINTTIKRACCSAVEDKDDKNFYKIKVRLPNPKGSGFERPDPRDPTKKIPSTLSNEEKKFKYQDIDIKVPKSICTGEKFLNYKNVPVNADGNSPCDNFYRAYCTNMFDEYLKLIGADKDTNLYNVVAREEYYKFKPECACFVPPLKSETVSGSKQVQPQCTFPCGKLSSAYKLSNKRTPCTIAEQICMQKVEVSAGQVGGAVNVNTKDQQMACTQQVENTVQAEKKAEETKKQMTEDIAKKTEDKIKTPQPSPQPSAQSTPQLLPKTEQQIPKPTLPSPPTPSTPSAPSAPKPTIPTTPTTQQPAEKSSMLPIIIIIIVIILMALGAFFAFKN
jgi:hypothetical protein